MRRNYNEHVVSDLLSALTASWAPIGICIGPLFFSDNCLINRSRAAHGHRGGSDWQANQLAEADRELIRRCSSPALDSSGDGCSNCSGLGCLGAICGVPGWVWAGTRTRGNSIEVYLAIRVRWIDRTRITSINSRAVGARAPIKLRQHSRARAQLGACSLAPSCAALRTKSSKAFQRERECCCAGAAVAATSGAAAATTRRGYTNGH